jgi:hypothetical protein
MSKEEELPFTPYWLDEKDWLCIIVYLPRDSEVERANDAEVTGYLLGYAQMTDTRMLALLGDPETQAYELLFSFRSPAHRKAFLQLVESNEITDNNLDFAGPPSISEIQDARPLAMVLDEDVVRHATWIATTMMVDPDSDLPN